MGDTVNVEGTVQVTITWPEVAHALNSAVSLVGVVPSGITDGQLAHLEEIIANARQRLREQSSG